MKNIGELENVHQVFVKNKFNKLIGAISLEELITFKFSKTFQEVLSEYKQFNIPMTVHPNEDISEVVKLFQKYDLTVLPVVDYSGTLLGRITSDDIYDILRESATEQIYNLAGVNDEAESENLQESIKKRGYWLFLNLLTAILASLVIGIFDSAIQSYVALAILMPIVASMGGNAGTQTLTIMVRQLALGEIDFENSKQAIKKEILISLANGVIFAVVIGLIAFVWFSDYMLGIVIAISMIVNLFFAGFFGALIPLMLKKMNVDPAIGSTVLLTTVTDVVGFFSFLGLANLILL
jgi:magnesium transporter